MSQTKRKAGRPKSTTPRVTISFRIPEAWLDAFNEIAAEETRAQPRGRGEVKVSQIYNQAFAEFLDRKGYEA